jgi:hypothetical protein
MRQDTLFMDSAVLLEALKLPELRMPEWQTDQSRQARQPVPAARPSAGRSTRTGAATQPPLTSRNAQTPRQTAPANQPAPDFRGSDDEGALPSPAAGPSEELLTTEDRPGANPAPAAPSRSARGNPIFSDEEFMLELPDYNPLLE